MNDLDSHLTDENDLRGVYAEPANAVRDETFPHLDLHGRRYIELLLSGDLDETVAAIRMRLCGRDGSEIVAARQAMQGQLWC
jgi:hypothetical protein